jgi:Fe-S cluster biogenesis protein NfuA
MNFDFKQKDLDLGGGSSKDPIFIQIEGILAALRPYITSHGGDVSLVDVKDGVVFIKFSGACVSCPLSFYTVTYGIERHIKVKLPEIVRVEVIEN